MITTERHLAKKYAAAALNRWKDLVDSEQIKQIEHVASLAAASEGKMLLLCAFIPHDMKAISAIAQVIIRALQAPSYVMPLIIALLLHRRLNILSAVFAQVVRLYRQRQGIEVCTVVSSHDLSLPLLEKLQRRAEHFIGRAMICRTMVDSSLIMGIRLEGETFTWERSIKKNLNFYYSTAVTAL